METTTIITAITDNFITVGSPTYNLTASGPIAVVMVAVVVFLWLRQRRPSLRR